MSLNAGGLVNQEVVSRLAAARQAPPGLAPGPGAMPPQAPMGAPGPAPMGGGNLGGMAPGGSPGMQPPMGGQMPQQPPPPQNLPPPPVSPTGPGPAVMPPSPPGAPGEVVGSGMGGTKFSNVAPIQGAIMRRLQGMQTQGAPQGGATY